MSEPCTSCLNAKAPLQCTHCGAPLCKACAVNTDFSCPACYEKNVIPGLETDDALMARARDVNVFYKSQGKESRFIRRTEKPIKVEGIPDRDEAILQLAVLAARAGFNTLLDVQLSTEKVQNGKWHSSIWSGTAIPASVDQAALDRRFINNPN